MDFRLRWRVERELVLVVRIGLREGDVPLFCCWAGGEGDAG